ncbi:FkbM family methyltransferase [Sulfurisphaera ohwakuensis]|uniref:FkbM family methyltransferase n=1 Tax=Sulfurisphaera ohwakuensis TaxID=69656 RepID=UPI0036F3CA3A
MVSRSEIILAYTNSLIKRLNLANYVKSIYMYYRTYENFANVIKSRIINVFPIEVKLRDGRSVILRNKLMAYYYTVYSAKVANFNMDEMFIEFDYNGNHIKLYGWRYGGDIAVFALDEYKFLSVKDRIVIDIGASIGDSPIYFALKGAKKVIAFEPFPKIYYLARKNVEENGLSDKIILVNAGCGYDGEVKVRDDIEANSSTSLMDYGLGVKIPVYSLDTIVRMYNIDNAVLKVDCEGCEYDLFNLATDKTLLKFDQIQIEYHHGYKDLVKRLKRVGFQVKYTIPEHNRLGQIIGYIYAWR